MFALLSTIETFLERMVNEYPVMTYFLLCFLEHLIEVLVKGGAEIVEAEFKKIYKRREEKNIKKAEEKGHVTTAQWTKKTAGKAWRCTPRRKRKRCDVENQLGKRKHGQRGGNRSRTNNRCQRRRNRRYVKGRRYKQVPC